MKKSAKKLVFSLFLIVTFYVAGALLVFDLSEPAYAFDQEYSNEGKHVAYGPRPRPGFFEMTYDDMHFDGTEWPFSIFRPICWIWINVAGYAPPGTRRSS